MNGDVFYGNFGDMVVVMWGGFDLIVDFYIYFKKGCVCIVVFQDFDFVYCNVESFVYGF